MVNGLTFGGRPRFFGGFALTSFFSLGCGGVASRRRKAASSIFCVDSPSFFFIGAPVIEKREISKSEADILLWTEESHWVDVKRIDIAPAKLSRSVSAFANTAGGEIFIGVDEAKAPTKQRTWRGFVDAEAANAHIAVIDGLLPLGGHYHADLLSCPDYPGLLLQLTVLKSREIIYATDGVPYVRRNAQNLPIKTDEALERLRLDKGISTFEDATVSVPAETITNSTTVINFIMTVVPTAEPDAWLRKQFVLQGDKPTAAGVLLFSDEPQAALPKRSAIKLFQYKTKSDESSRDTLAFDPLTIEGCLYDQIAEAVRKTKELIEGMKTLGDKSLENVVYPDETLHEIITNALLHRDYSIPADVQVRIYDNRIEIESPGRLPGHVTPENILNEQSARNPKIVRLINKFPDAPNKDVGEGLNTAFEAMKRLRLKEPTIEEREFSVVVHIRHTPLASPHDTVIEYLKDNQSITNQKARELTGIRSENSMKNVFLSLKTRDLIEQVPGRERGGGAAWQLAQPVNDNIDPEVTG